MARAIDGNWLYEKVEARYRVSTGIEHRCERDFLDLICNAPTLTPPNEWVSVEDRLPELPDRKWCEVMVITAQKGDNKSRVMIYERAVVRGKQVERWKYHWDRIADETPDFWMPLPEPPESRPTEGEENGLKEND